MVAVFVTSLLRERMRPGTWRAIHWLAYLTWPIALAHTFGMGTDAHEAWVILLGVICGLSVVAALAWRLRTASRQTAARAAQAALPGVPAKHLSLGPHRVGTRRD
jgi:sulfoxide reductase heme-binding subunit YedZ